MNGLRHMGNRNGKSAAVRLAPLILAIASGFAAGEQVLFDFSDEKGAGTWRSINDTVMGGVSKGAFKVTGDGLLEFSGELSLENRGGFASILSYGEPRDLSSFEGVAVRLRGDGRPYYLDLRTNTSVPAATYRVGFTSEAGTWQELRFPFSAFQAAVFGRPMPNATPLETTKIRSVGFTLVDKKAGPFKLEVDWIKAVTPQGADSKAVTPQGADGGAVTAQGADIVDTASAAGGFTTLLAAAKAAGLVAALRGEGPLTVFAPTDEAFKKLPEGTVETLLRPENKDKLTSILTHHVVKGRITFTDQKLATLEGSSLPLSIDGSLKVGPATVLKADIHASNGIIHVIDTVLIPQSKPTDPAGSAQVLIKLAIERGAPLFNAGDATACASIYEVTARSLLALPGLGDKEKARLSSALDEAGRVSDGRRQAWILRYALDDVYAKLQGTKGI